MTRYPFKFLDSYDREDRAFFFGRDEEIARLYEMVYQADLILLYGASGTGKTSLIQCGLASKFESHDWLPLFVRRGQDINASLDAALHAAGGEALPEGLDWLEEDLAGEGPLAASPVATSPLASRLRALYLRHFKPIYLIFDQFEELYVLGKRQEQAAFVQTVQDLLHVEQPVKVILSMREEYLGHLYEFERAVPELLRKKLRVEPMNLDRVTTVLLGVSSQPDSNVQLEAGHEAAIAEGIFEKIRGQDKTLHIPLPYLQVFLDKFYTQVTGDESRRAEATFTRPALAAMGDLGDVLRNFLDEQARAISRAQGLPEAEVWRALSPFVTLEGTKEPLAEAQLAARLSDLPTGTAARLLQALVQGRILRFSEASQLYEIAHDALAKQIHAKRSDEEIAILEVQRLVKSQTAMKAEAREYFTEKQLLFMEPYLEKLVLGEGEREWIGESRVRVQQQKEEAQRRQERELAETRKRLRIVRGLLVLALLAVVVAGYLGYSANQQRKTAEAALAEVRLKNASIFESFTTLGTELIYQLDHAGALEKLKVAAEIEVDAQIKKQRLTAPLEELLFFFAESGRRPELAREAATVLLALQPSSALTAQLKKSLQENWETRSQFAPLLKALQSYQNLQTRYYPRMVSVPLGEEGIFEMGSGTSEQGHQSDETLHKVQLSAYQMAETPITFYQFAMFCEAVERGIASRAPYWGLRGDHPAVNVIWYESAEYANWLNEQHGQSPSYTVSKTKNSDRNNKVQNDFLKWKVDWIEESKGYRLPTEAEWELAARGGVGVSRTLYAGSDILEEVGWYWQNSGDKPLDGDWDLNRIYDNNGRTHAVKGKRPNGLGIYDLSGNVYEWCWDWYDANYYEECAKNGTVESPTGPQGSADGRVIRGGSWGHFAADCRSAYRDRDYPDYRSRNVGFRLVFVPQ